MPNGVVVMLKAVPLFFLAHAVGASAAPLTSCVQVIEAWRDAVDCQTTEDIPYLTWPDGFSKWPGAERGKWSDISMGGPCGKYSTTLREWRPGPVYGDRQVVRVKSIIRRVDGRYTGDYTVAKMRYTCQRRAGKWRIFSQEVTHRVDLTNQAAARRYRSDGG
jgi:hypothetical protein